MTSIATQISAINVPFHGANLYIVNHNGEPYAPMKPIIDGMGMDWASQFTKLKTRFKTCVVKITMQLPGDDQQRDVTCLALRKLNGWLQTIGPNKVKPEIRDKVIQYQEECDDVLYEYWTKGLVVNPRKSTKKALPGKITIEQQEAVKQLVMNRGKALPKENQAKAIITMWSALKTHFGCSYKEINEDQFTEALSLVARVPIEGEFLGKQEALPAPPTATLCGRLVMSIEDGVITSSQPIPDNWIFGTTDTFEGMLKQRGFHVIHESEVNKFVRDRLNSFLDTPSYIEKC